MEAKKTKKADLEHNRLLFLLIGLAATLAFVLLAFEWESSSGEVEELEMTQMETEEEIIIQTQQEQVKPPPPPPPKQVAEILNIVEDDVEIEEEMEVEDFEVDEETEVIIVDDLEEEEEEEEAPIFYVVEEMPKFPGGELELRKYIAENVRYPTIARENDIKGKVFVRFVVNEKGNVENVSIARGVDPLLDEEAIRVVKGLPKWKPGKQRGKPVKVWYTVPINFTLQ